MYLFTNDLLQKLHANLDTTLVQHEALTFSSYAHSLLVWYLHPLFYFALVFLMF